MTNDNRDIGLLFTWSNGSTILKTYHSVFIPHWGLNEIFSKKHNMLQKKIFFFDSNCILILGPAEYVPALG